MKWSLTIEDIVTLLECDPAEGSYTGRINSIADLRRADSGELSFLGSAKFRKYLEETRASVILVPRDTQGGPREHQTWIRVADPSHALGDICEHIEHLIRPRPGPGKHPTATIDPDAAVDPSAYIGPYCIIEKNAQIGPGAILMSHVRIEQDAVIGGESVLHHGVSVGWSCRVGRKCTLFHGCVIGSDGFGFHSSKSGHSRLVQIGIVVLEDNVEVGANAAIDRARFAETRIGEGSKLDNLVQVGHNVIMGKHCILCGQVGVSGSTEIGNFVILAGQVGVSGHLTIGDGVTATGQTGITKDVPAGTVLSGTPGRPHREAMKLSVLIHRLPLLAERVRELEKIYADR